VSQKPVAFKAPTPVDKGYPKSIKSKVHLYHELDVGSVPPQMGSKHKASH
jgi:hypothetical protein